MRLSNAVVFIVVGLSLSPAWGQAEPEPIKLGSVILTGSIRSRVENWQWFTPNSGDPGYTFLGNHLRLNFTRPGKSFDWTFELAAPILLGLPDNAVATGVQGQLGLGASYFVSNGRNTNAAMIFPKQAFIRAKNLFGSEATSVRIGRFEFQDGSEVTAKNPTIGVIKRDRVQQRLIGPFVFTHVMRSFDGFHAVYNKPKINYTLIGAFPTRGVFQTDGWGWMKTGFAYASATGQVQAGAKNTGEWRLFGIYYHDWRHILKQDNRPAAVRTADIGNIRIGTYGGHYVHVTETGGGPVDLLGIAAGQLGKWGTLDHRAGMVDLEGGFQPRILPRLKPWLRAGYYYGSGDNNPADNKHGTFFQILPTARPFARFPFFDMMNNEDRFGMLTIRPHKQLTLKTEVHALRLANHNDLWYVGGGAFQPWTFGYQSRSGGGARGLANLYDVSGDVTVNAHFSFTLYYGYAQGKSVIEAIYPRGKDGHLGYAELNFRL
jgi:Alginate export